MNLAGRGGMGEVYRALDLRLEQIVAIKFLPDAKAGQAAFAERLLSEVRIARQITHPNVCRVYDIGEIDGQPFITMEYVDGEDLGSLLRRIGRIPADKAAEMARRLSLGLAAAHEKGVLHRDLKPANIMIDSRGHVLITDFGVAGFAGQLQGDEKGGTAAYMAPEQLTGKAATIQSDLYSLGLVLFEMFTGKRPFEGSSVQELANARQGGPFLSASVLVTDLNPAIDRIISKCLDPDPHARPASAFAVASAFPGDDALAAAVAAGETPSPDMVAASGTIEGLTPRMALFCSLFIAAALVLMTLLSGRATLVEQAHLERSTDSLDESARRILRSVGHVETARDSAHGFFFTSAFLRYQHDRSGDRGDSVPAVPPQPIAFWYRDSPTYLETRSFMCCDAVPGGIWLWEPAPQVPGERLLVLTPSGQMQRLEVLPARVDDSGTHARTLDWESVFGAAGLRREDFQPVPSRWLPEFFADERAAWLGSYPGEPPGSLRVEAASLNGRLAFFQIVTAYTRPGRDDPFQSPPAQRASDSIGVVLITVVTTLGLWLAVRNLKLRRGDRRGAIRLLAIGYGLDVLSWVLLGSHVPRLNYEWRLLEMATGWALFRAAVLWLFYMALEPYVRRRWPHVMISWIRLLAGRFRDAKVGGDILIGVASGCATALLFQIYQALVKSWIDLGPLVALKGPRHAAGLWLADLHSSVVLAFVTLFLFLLLRTALRQQWLAVTAFCLIQGAVVAVQDLGDGVIIGLQYLLVALFLVRFGFVTVATGIFVYTIFVSFPITANVSSWYFGTSLFALFSIATLAGFALQTTLAGRRLIKDELW
jgi:serine/threonine-protein kinase